MGIDLNIEKPKTKEENLKKINELPEKPETRPMKIFPWEPALVRRPDPNNADDIEEYKRIEAQPTVKEWMSFADALSTTEEVQEMFQETFYGIYKEEKEKSTMEGFIWLYKPEKNPRKNLKKSKLIDPSDIKHVLEISFARFIDNSPSAENRERGLISSAVRQICFSILEKQSDKIIAAWTSPKNVLSEGVLKNAGFVTKGEVVYDEEETKEKDHFWVLDKNELEKILEKKRANYEKTAGSG